MKNLYKIILTLLVVVGVSSCDETDNFSIDPQQTDFTIEVPNSGTNILLDNTNPNNQALTITWSDTQNSDVSYTVEFSNSGTDFTEGFNAGTTDSNNLTWTVEELNTFLINTVRLPQVEASTIDIRVVASNGETSNVITLTVTPFVIEVTELFVNGTFTSWDPAQGITMNTSGFNIFTINIDLADGDEFNFIPSNTSDEIVWQLVDAGSNEVTKFGGVNISGYSAGNYDIIVNLNNNTFTIDEVVIPETLFLVGSLTGWDPATSLPFTSTSLGVFTITVDLANDDEFKFLPTNTGWDGDWGEDASNPGNIIQEGEQNVSGYSAGTYLITVDFNTLTFTLVEIIQSSRIAVPGNHQGWDPGSAPQLEASSTSTTDYEGYVWLDGEHKFVGPDGSGNFAWGNTDWGDDGSFTGLLLVDGESNCNAPTAGHYFIQTDTNSLTYSETMYNWGLIGDATGSWAADQDMTYDAGSGTWVITLDLVVGEIKFRANDGWDWNYGDFGADGSLEIGGDNMAISTAGNYTIILDLSTPRAYTYSVTLN